jgi:hypothetical protein
VLVIKDIQKENNLKTITHNNVSKMSALVSALDTFTPSQLGENGTQEYTGPMICAKRLFN